MFLALTYFCFPFLRKFNEKILLKKTINCFLVISAKCYTKEMLLIFSVTRNLYNIKFHIIQYIIHISYSRNRIIGLHCYYLQTRTRYVV